MQLNPRENFSIVRQIEDHTDSSQYYVRAVIRNAKTDALITVNGLNYINLTDRGGQRFSKNWQVPADASGQGFYVSILTCVFTDSGYTTKSPNYGDKMETYLVAERFNQNIGGGAGGGPDIDYKKIRKIVNEVVKERIEKDVEIPEQLPAQVITTEKTIVAYKEHPEVKIPDFPSFAPVLSAIKEVGDKVEAIEIPEPNLGPVVNSIVDAMEMLEEIKNKPQDNTKSEEILSKVDAVEKLVTPPPLPPAPVVSPYKQRADKLLGKAASDEKLLARAKKLL